MWRKEAIKLLDEHYPPCGECVLCGHKDKRHRLWDAFISFNDNGYSVEQIMDEYPYHTYNHIWLVCLIRPYHKGGNMPDIPNEHGTASMEELAIALGSSKEEAEMIATRAEFLAGNKPKIIT